MSKHNPLVSAWNRIKSWPAVNTEQYLAVTLPASADAADVTATALKPYESYFRIWLADMFLTESRQWFTELFPAVHSVVKLRYGDYGTVSLNNVVGLPEEVRGQGVALNYCLCELTPFSGGTVEIAAGLLALRNRDNKFVAAAFDLFSEFANLIAPPLAPALSISKKVASGVNTLFEAADGQVHLSMHQTLTSAGGGGSNELRPGYRAVILGTPEQLDAARLSVIDDRLYYKSGSGAPQPLRGYDYMLLRIESRDERDDWRLKSIQEPVEKATQALLRGDKEEAHVFHTLALTTTAQSPDLTPADRRRVVVAINDELTDYQAIRNNAVADSERDLNDIMAARAMPLELARSQPELTLREALEATTVYEQHNRLMPEVAPGIDGESDEAFSLVPADLDDAVLKDVDIADDKRLIVTGDDDDKSIIEFAPDAPQPPQYKRINAWVVKREDEPAQPLQLGATYTLAFKVGRPVQSSLITTPSAYVPESDIPPEGLETTWVVTSWNVELADAPHSIVPFQVEAIEAPQSWKAEGKLLIPRHGESAVGLLSITPLVAEDAAIDIVIFARDTLYRQFRLELRVDGPHEPPPLGEDSSVKISSEVIHTPAVFTGLRPQHEWQTPRGTLSIIVFGQGKAYARGDIFDGNGTKHIDTLTDWSAAPAQVAGPIKNVRDAANQFREQFTDELNEIDRRDLIHRLQDFRSRPHNFWADDLSDPVHQQVWQQQISTSAELQMLAYSGYQLYESFFPPNSALRKWLDALPPDWRLDISWSAKSDSSWVASVPWGLFYGQAPVPGEAIDPMYFWGLRYRLNYIAHAIDNPLSPALGGLDKTTRAYGFYWGKTASDQEIADEVQWQQQEWTSWGQQTFLPDAGAQTPPKSQLVELLNKPAQQPATIIYFFCHCEVGTGNKPVLRFGSTNAPADNLSLIDLGALPLQQQPLIFVNACTSAGSDPYTANELEQIFFRRGCRAYLGTEVKVPIQLASRFAKIFYSFFYRDLDSKPIAAGEAIFQARRFLWREYRNLGGLLYTYINHFELYMASEVEVDALHGHN
ncbi:MAG TPA: CHAT domain-containing protein [Pyrinomonadaceae bacterium]|nr:CHAT domain-containing protein [Pyrinomonadaceae bacterium]